MEAPSLTQTRKPPTSLGGAMVESNDNSCVKSLLQAADVLQAGVDVSDRGKRCAISYAGSRWKGATICLWSTADGKGDEGPGGFHVGPYGSGRWTQIMQSARQIDSLRRIMCAEQCPIPAARHGAFPFLHCYKHVYAQMSWAGCIYRPLAHDACSRQSLQRNITSCCSCCQEL